MSSPNIYMYINTFIGKNPHDVKDWGQEEKGATENEMVEWHHQLDGHEFEQAPGVGDGQGSLVSCSWWGHKELDTTEELNWTELKSLGYTPETLNIVSQLYLIKINKI